MTISEAQARTAIDGRRWTLRPARPTDARPLLGGCSAGEFGASSIAGLHHSGSLRIEADAYCSRVIAFGREYISRHAEPQAGDSAVRPGHV